MRTLLVSACLLGFACKYSGGSNALPEETLAALRERYRLIPVCPECAGGLPVPRTSAERQGRWVTDRDGRDVTAQFEKGALVALRLARLFGQSPQFWLNLQRNVDIWDSFESGHEAIEAIEPLSLASTA